MNASSPGAPRTVYIAYTAALAIIAFFLTYAFVGPSGPVKSARLRRRARRSPTTAGEPVPELVEEPAQ